ncbi:MULTISPECIES: mannose-1-phosphate guanylyltransferase [Paraburkholderia]|uniref:mannose-1-phosphate guanylyltransferase n=1 Tax=Paraburkholderia TaxID=1822464 RepID=UPI0003620FA9|nr:MULTISPECIES: sugar phosphate nucleotidyltransferase [Paraburkholderia]MDH6147971.1 mannose-1-phosphate guanylyltransferase/mannose-6-phosphate isomerase [Paraburkholderia sp. WSM4179]
MNRIVEPGYPLAPQAGTAAALRELTVQPVILASGSGTRLWPLSRERNPKQRSGLMGDQSLLEATLRRLDDAFDPAAPDATRTTPPAVPLVVCCEELRLPTLERVEQYRKPVRILLEPMARNTAPALTVAALAARASAAAGDDPILVALPADHPIADRAAFGAALNEALAHASRGAIVTLGVPPQRAATGYSYIRTAAALGNRGARTIERFVEKPDAELAERYFASGEYWWNSGMYVVRASVWLDAIGLCRPLIAAACKEAFAGASVDDAGVLHLARDAFAACPSDSVDYAVMERMGTDARLVGVTVPLDAGWSDTGARDSVWDASSKDGDERFLLSENQSTLIPPGVGHRLENAGKTPLEIIEGHSGGDPGEDDIVRFDDRYGREHGSAHARHGSSDG